MISQLHDIGGTNVMEASIGSLLRTVFWIVVSFYVIRLIARMSVVYAVNKTREELQNQTNHYNNQAKGNARSNQRNVPDAEDVEYIEIKED
jgi:mannitol-specific phosphotransferase system IIBC component